MRAIRAAAAVVGLFLVSSAFAQTATDELEAARGQIQADRKAIVAKLMTLTDGEGAGFWPVYNEYREATRKVDDRLVKLMGDYDKESESMTDQRSQQMLNEWLTIMAEKVAVKKSYLKKFSKALPSAKVIRYYQIENKMDAVIQYELAQGIPLVG